MDERLSPQALRSLATALELDDAARAVLIAHADAWERERAALEEELAEVRQKLNLLEQDREWWKANVIKRRKRAAERRTGRREERPE